MRPFRQYARSDRGKELVALAEGGTDPFRGQDRLYPLQKRVFLEARDYWMEQAQQEANSKIDNPSRGNIPNNSSF